MKRDIVILTLAFVGAALLCFAALDWVDYQGFIVSLRWR